MAKKLVESWTGAEIAKWNLSAFSEFFYLSFMISQKTLDKWEKILKEKYGQDNLKKEDVFKIANIFTEYFYLLTKSNYQDSLKKKNNDNQ